MVQAERQLFLWEKDTCEDFRDGGEGRERKEGGKEGWAFEDEVREGKSERKEKGKEKTVIMRQKEKKAEERKGNECEEEKRRLEGEATER